MNELDLRQQLLDQRRILVSGPLDSAATGEIAAMLMTLDGRSDESVQLVVSGPGGPITDALALLDIIGLMRAPVDTTCLGAVAGTATALVASGTGTRRAPVRATLSLRCDDPHQVDGSAADVSARADELVAVRQRYVALLAAFTGRPVDDLEPEVDRGGALDATAALALGLIDEIQR